MFAYPQINADTLARLHEVAQEQERTLEDVVQSALDSYLSSISWLETEVNKARAEMRAGKGISHEAMKDKVRKLGFHVN